MNSDADWRLLSSFLRVAQAGSLTGAAVTGEVSQPTLSRHIRQLEESLGVTLFDRHAQGLTLTTRGVALYERVEAIGAQVDAFYRQATGLAEQIHGVVRVSVGEVLGLAALQPWMQAFCRTNPQIELEWVIDNRASNLLTREADLAVRMFQPEQADLVVTRLGELRQGFFASPAYLDRVGHPVAPDAIAHLVGYDRDLYFIRAAARQGLQLQRSDFIFRSDSVAAQLQAVEAGFGVGVLPVAQALDHGLTWLFPDVTPSQLTIWLVAHPEVHRSARVRLVFDGLRDALRDHLEDAETRAASARGGADDAPRSVVGEDLPA